MSEEEKVTAPEEQPEEKEKEAPAETPKDAPETKPEESAEPYVPSPKWKRVLAWVLFGVVCLGIFLWLLGIARPDWVETVKSWF